MALKLVKKSRIKLKTSQIAYLVQLKINFMTATLFKVSFNYVVSSGITVLWGIGGGGGGGSRCKSSSLLFFCFFTFFLSFKT